MSKLANSAISWDMFRIQSSQLGSTGNHLLAKIHNFRPTGESPILPALRTPPSD
jgi:hypothetical protein